MAQTEREIQDAIQQVYDATSETLDSDDDDYIMRRGLINRAIQRWGNAEGHLWRELFVDTTQENTGMDRTISTGVTDYKAPELLRFPAASVIRVRTGTAGDYTYHKYPIIEQDQLQLYDSSNTRFAFFYGNTSEGKKMRLNPAPESDQDGGTILYEFYKYPTELEGEDDVAEMPDVEMIINFVIAHLKLQDDDIDAYNTFRAESEANLRTMEIYNQMAPRFGNRQIPDLDRHRGISFGT